MVFTLKVPVDGNKNSGIDLTESTKFWQKFNEILRYGNVIDATDCANIDSKDILQIFTSRTACSR